MKKKNTEVEVGVGEKLAKDDFRKKKQDLMSERYCKRKVRLGIEVEREQRERILSGGTDEREREREKERERESLKEDSK